MSIVCDICKKPIDGLFYGTGYGIACGACFLRPYGSEKANLVPLEICCDYCGRLLMRVECDPGTNAIGMLTCPDCGDTRTFDATEMMAMEEI